MAGLYIHIPFCKKRCVYCDFFSSTDLGRKEKLLLTIGEELERQAGFLEGAPVETLYFGGGTPTLCSPAELSALITRTRELFDTSRLTEITVEANPDDLHPRFLEELRATGINRLSIGIQSFIDRDLQWMNRRHDAETAHRTFEEARRAGFENLSLDLIYGLPTLTSAEWEYNIREALALGPDHISAYHLTLEEKTVLGRRKREGTIAEIEESVSLAQFSTLHHLLAEQGYEHYEVSNFARPGRRSVHNSNYWYDKPYLGVGPSAHSYNGRIRRWNVNNLARYLENAPFGMQFEQEKLSDDDLYNEYVMTSLRCDRGVDPLEAASRFGKARAEYFLREAVPFITAGTLVEHEGRYRIPPPHYLISDSIISQLFVSG